MNPIHDLHDSIYCESPSSKLICLGDKFPAASMVKMSQLFMSFMSILPYLKYTDWWTGLHTATQNLFAFGEQLELCFYVPRD